MNEKQWKNRAAELGCILCWHNDQPGTPANLHHVREGQGMSQRSSDLLVTPLCKEHHQGKTGIHGAIFYHTWRLDEMDLLAMTIREIIRPL